MEKIKRLSFIHTILIAILVLILYYTIFLQYDESINLTEQRIILTREAIEQKKKEVEDLETLVQNFASLQGEYNEATKSLNIFSQYMSEIENATTFFSQIINDPAIRTIGIQVNAYESEKAMPLRDNLNNVLNNNYKLIPLMINIEGSFSQLLVFMSHLTQIKQLIAIESLDIIKTEKDRSDGQLSLLSLTGKIILYSLTSQEDQLELQEETENNEATDATSNAQPEAASSQVN